MSDFCNARQYRPSRYVDFGLIYQQNRDVITDRIDPVALAAFQAFAVSFYSQRLLTQRANQNIQQILGNHVRIVLQSRLQCGVAQV